MREFFARLRWLIQNVDYLKLALADITYLRQRTRDLEKDVGEADSKAQEACGRANAAENYLRAATREAVDLGFKGDASYIVLVGRYHGKDHVQVMDVTEREFNEILQLAREHHRYVGHGRYDAPAPALREFFHRRR